MPPRLNLSGAYRSLSIRIKPLALATRHPPIFLLRAPASSRGFADEKTPKSSSSGFHPDLLDHVGEGRADIVNSMDEMASDMGGTFGQGGLERGREGEGKGKGKGVGMEKGMEKEKEMEMEKVSEVVNGEMQVSKDEGEGMTVEGLIALGEMAAAEQNAMAARDPDAPGQLFGLPNLPLPSHLNLKHRYDPAVDQFTKLIMKHGKLSAAQRHMSMILNYLRMAPPPKKNPNRPLLPGSPPPAHLPLNPILYLTLAIDSVAPLLRIRSLKGAAGGGTALKIPVPLGLRQRRRAAVMWILDAVAKKPSRGSGRGQFAQRVAEELISVAEGRSSAWEKRQIVHKTATGARVNLQLRRR